MRRWVGMTVGAILMVSSAQAGTNTVATLADSGAGSLRQAIADSIAGDVIAFAVTGTIALTSGELAIGHSLEISGPGATNLAVSGNSASRVFNVVDPGAAVTISGLTIRDGKSANGIDADEFSGGPALSPGGDGGGIYSLGSLTLNQCHVTGNVAGRGGNSSWSRNETADAGTAGGSGGGVYCANGLTASACTFSGNSAGAGGTGGLSLERYGGNGGPGGHGGGVCALGSVALVSCTFAANAAGNGGGGGRADAYAGHGAPGGSGGGLYVSGSVSVVACTFATNAAGSGGSGGGQAAVCGNGGPGGAGGGICAAASTAATTRNNLIAQNRAGGGGAGGSYEYGNPGAAGANGTGFDLAGDWTSAGHNLLGTVEGCTGLANGVNGDVAGSTGAPVDALLYPLANGGDPTPTMGLPTTSPAFNAGDDALLDPPYGLATDQRGQPRKSYDHVDVGAFETQLQAPLLAAPTVTLQSDPANGLTLATLHTTVNPRGSDTGLKTDFGVTTNYVYPVAPVSYPAGFALVPTDVSLAGLAPGLTYHFRLTATNAAGTETCADQTFSTPEFFARGDADGDGAVAPDELAAVYANYWQGNPSVISNSFGLGETNVQLEIENALGWDLTVQASDDLLTWSNLPVRAVPVFRFGDPDATNHPNRTYRLLAP